MTPALRCGSNVCCAPHCTEASARTASLGDGARVKLSLFVRMPASGTSTWASGCAHPMESGQSATAPRSRRSRSSSIDEASATDQVQRHIGRITSECVDAPRIACISAAARDCAVLHELTYNKGRLCDAVCMLRTVDVSWVVWLRDGCGEK